MKIKLKNLLKGRTILTNGKPKHYNNGEVVEMTEPQAKAYIDADVGEEVKEEEPKKRLKLKNRSLKSNFSVE